MYLVLSMRWLSGSLELARESGEERRRRGGFGAEARRGRSGQRQRPLEPREPLATVAADVPVGPQRHGERQFQR